MHLLSSKLPLRRRGAKAAVVVTTHVSDDPRVGRLGGVGQRLSEGD